MARCALPFNPQLAFGNSKGFLSNTVRYATLVSEGFLIRGSASDPRVPFLTAIFPITAAIVMQIGEALHQLDAQHELSSVQPVTNTLSQLTFSLHQFLASRR